VIIQFGNPSSGGANGVPYLPSFWTDIGPFLPPRNAYLLLRNTVYFDGHATAAAVGVLLGYMVVFGVILMFLNWFRSPTEDLMNPQTEQAARAAAAGAAGAGTA
jgi:hypothetical protein